VGQIISHQVSRANVENGRGAVSGDLGHWAVQAFWAQKPVNWRPQDLSGDSDAGLDALVQVVVNHRVCEDFHTQLKGSNPAGIAPNDSPRMNSTKSIIPIEVIRNNQDC